MSENILSQKMQKLEEEEERQLLEMRLNRYFDTFELERMKKETEKRNEEEEIKNLTAVESDLLKKLNDVRKKIFQLKMEATSWETLAKNRTDELRNLEKKLNDGYTKIWTNREHHCNKIDALLIDLNNKTTNEYKSHKDSKTEEDIRKLTESITVEEDLDKSYTKTITEHQEEMEKLRQVPAGPEYKRLEEWIQITRDRCTELNRRIREKRKSTDANMNPNNNQLFSIVNLEDVKKLTRNWN